MLQRFVPVFVLALAGPLHCAVADQSAKPELVQVKKIWDAAPHNAFTDLVRWNQSFYCAFREGQGHAGDIGSLRIIASADGEQWRSVGKLSLDEFDLRDAAISVMPDKRLMILGGAQQNRDGVRLTGTFVSYSADGTTWTKPKIVVPMGRWLWRVTWNGDTAYGVDYGAPNNSDASSLLATRDGSHYETIAPVMLKQGGRSTEARIRFDSDGTAYCLHRRDDRPNTAFLGTAKPPYKDWNWHDLGIRLGGPNFVQLPSGQWIAAGRLYDNRARTELLSIDMESKQMKPVLELPSGGDTSYPGMVWHDGHLWVSYYSSHEGKTSIYLAKVRFPASDINAIDIGTRRELFVDRLLVDQMNSTRFRSHPPVPAETVLKFDRPWEGVFCGYVTVMKDTDRYRMYYRGLPEAGGDNSDLESTCYAESEDGINWTKPDLGLYDFDGNRQNNIVLRGHSPASHNFSPFLDANPDAQPHQRFKALGGGPKGLVAFVSGDGLKWSPLQEAPVFTKGIFDSQNVSFWSSAEQQYLCYFRTWTETGYAGYRTISRTTSKDFVTWTDPVPMSFGDTPYEHLYTNQTHPYFNAPHLYVGVAARFMPGRQVISESEAKELKVNPKYFGDVSDAILLTSRGGTSYDRTFMESFLRPGQGLQNWVSRTNYPALGIVPTGEGQMSMYVQRNYGQPTASLQRLTMRTDGFASINAPYSGGYMQTNPILVPSIGREVKLTINCATSAAGSIRVELTDATGDPIAGFTANDSDEIIGDRINKVVTWKGNANLSELSSKPIRMRFVMKDADLFAIQFK